jgi:hypothetical protein
MPVFKHKKKTYNPKKDEVVPTTIDDKHHNKLQEIEELYKSIPNKEKEIDNLEKEYNNLCKIKEGDISNNIDLIIERKLECREKINNIKRMIDKIKNDYINKDYELGSCHILFHYFNENIDDKKITQKSIQHINKNKKSILDFFTKKSDNKQDQPMNNEHYTNNKSKSILMDEYLSYIDTTYVKKGAFQTYFEEICQLCKEQKIINMMESVLICPNCGSEEKILIDSELPSYKEPPREVTYFAYKRINHFKEWLSQLQAKESTNIDKDIFDKIYNELNKEKYIDKSKLKSEQVLQILKKLGLSKYYEHCPYITNQISGRPALNIDPETEEKAINMFKEVQGPWMKYGMNDRSNFFSYPYILYKFFQLLEKDEYLQELRLLKTREKLQEQDQVWKKICDELKWEFIRTV